MWDQYFHIDHSTSLWPVVNSVFDRWDQTKPLWCFDLYTLSLIWSGGLKDLRARHKDDTHSKHWTDRRSKLFHSEERAWRLITAVPRSQFQRQTQTFTRRTQTDQETEPWTNAVSKFVVWTEPSTRWVGQSNSIPAGDTPAGGAPAHLTADRYR